MEIVVTVFLFITAIVLGPLIIIFSYLHLRRRAVNKREVQELQNQISQMRVDIEEINEQLADFIIRTS